MKNELLEISLFSAGVMTGTNVLTSPVINLNFLDNLGVQLHFTGTPTGTFQVQVSADYNPTTHNAGHWVAIVLDPVPVAAGAPDDIYIDMNQLSAPWVRVVYTNASGSGVLDGFATAKSVGG